MSKSITVFIIAIFHMLMIMFATFKPEELLAWFVVTNIWFIAGWIIYAIEDNKSGDKQ